MKWYNSRVQIFDSFNAIEPIADSGTHVCGLHCLLKPMKLKTYQTKKSFLTIEYVTHGYGEYCLARINLNCENLAGFGFVWSRIVFITDHYWPLSEKHVFKVLKLRRWNDQLPTRPNLARTRVLRFNSNSIDGQLYTAVNLATLLHPSTYQMI